MGTQNLLLIRDGPLLRAAGNGGNQVVRNEVGRRKRHGGRYRVFQAEGTAHRKAQETEHGMEENLNNLKRGVTRVEGSCCQVMGVLVGTGFLSLNCIKIGPVQSQALPSDSKGSGRQLFCTPTSSVVRTDMLNVNF